VRAVSREDRQSDAGIDADQSGAVPAQTVVEAAVDDRTVVPDKLEDRLTLARLRLRAAAENGDRIRVYEVALDLDMSEFHFARQFRAAFGCSPHVFYDEVRAARARAMLRAGCTQGQAARRIGLRRPAELRALLARRQGLVEIG
jgi:AraC-like DNA-binding protein